MKKIFKRAMTRRLLTATLIGSVLVTIPPVSPAGATSSGCAAVNAGAWNAEITSPPHTQGFFDPLPFNAGETISIEMTASSSSDGGGGASTFLRLSPSNETVLILSTGSMSFGTATAMSGSYTLTASGAVRAGLAAGNGLGTGSIINSSTFTCTDTPVACLPGSYSSTGFEPCTPAEPGHFVPSTGSVAQFACSPGYFQANSGSNGCEPAPPGRYVDTIAATSAAECPPGTYQPQEAMTMCVVAEPGSYVPTYGATERTLCPAGYYQPSAAGVSCIAAAPGYFVPAPGAVAQTPCPLGSTSEGAAVACTPIYVFTGFAAPVDPTPNWNSARAGQTIPLKFTVTDSDGTPVATLTSVSVTVTSLACTVGTSADAIEEYASGGSGLQYLGDGQYQFNWKTPKSYASSCKTITLDIGDGVAHSALFEFKK